MDNNDNKDEPKKPKSKPPAPDYRLNAELIKSKKPKKND